MEAYNGVMPVYNLADNNYHNGYGFGGCGDSMWLLIFFALFGWGGNGFGHGFNNSVTSDFLLNQTSRLSEQILTQANATNQGICDSTYAINNSLRDLGAQMAQCCCDNRFDMSQGFCGVNRNIDNLRYEMAEKFCAVYNNQARDTAQILQAISDKGYQEQIRELERDNLALSQRNQTTTILASVRDMLEDTGRFSV
jgi:hypothetical protein